jgi:hypothetical protein
MIARILAGAALAAMASQNAHAADDPTEAAFRATYKELVETNTSLSSGSCTLAAQRMGTHLKAAGFADDQITYFATPEPKSRCCCSPTSTWSRPSAPIGPAIRSR